VTLGTDFKSSIRGLVRAPASFLALVVTIAAGVGGNAVVFGFVHGTAARDMPLPSSTVSLFSKDAAGTLGPLDYRTVETIRAQTTVLDRIGIALQVQRAVTLDGQTSLASVGSISAELADLLTLKIARGAAVSPAAWNASGPQLPGRPQIIRVNDRDVAIESVAPDWLPGLYAGRDIDVWLPLADADLQHTASSSSVAGSAPAMPMVWAIGRLRDRVSAQEAQSAINAVLPVSDQIAILPYTGVPPELAGGMLQTKRLLAWAILGVFIVACGNVTIFLLARVSARSRETALRVALGANRVQLSGQLLFESIIIAGLGAALGLILAFWARNLIPLLFFSDDASHLVFALEPQSMIVAAIACTAILGGCGLLPLWTIRADEPAAILRQDVEGLSPRARRVRQALVVGTMSCVCVLVVCTGLLIDGFKASLRTAAGRSLGEPVVAQLQADQGSHGERDAVEYFRRVQLSMAKLPNVSAAAWTNVLPGRPPVWQLQRFEVADPPTADVSLSVEAFTPTSLARVRPTPVSGRMFGGADAPGGCMAVMVNEAADTSVFNGHAVGRAMVDPTGARVEIVGTLAERTDRPDRARESTSAEPAVYYYADQIATPFGQTGPMKFRVPVLPPSEADGFLSLAIVSSSYFDVMGMSVVAGKIFSDDVGASACRAGVINQEAADLYFGGHAVGGSLIDERGRRTTIVGVVRTPALRTSQRRPEPTLFVPLAQNFMSRLALVVATRQRAQAFVPALQLALAGIAGGHTTTNVTTLDDYMSRTGLASQRLQVALMTVTAATAIVLGIIGMLGMLVESVRQRRWEVAVRVAFGAGSWQVTNQVLGEGLRLAGLACAIGFVVSIPMMIWVSRSIAGSAALNVWGIALATVTLGLAATIASLLPIRMALRASPLSLLKRDS